MALAGPSRALSFHPVLPNSRASFLCLVLVAEVSKELISHSLPDGSSQGVPASPTSGVCVAEWEPDLPSLAQWTQAVILFPCLDTVIGGSE